jgi:MFS family permease
MRIPWPRGGLWRHPDFLKLWSAETISQLGTQISLLALPLVAIIVLESSPFEVALLGTIEFLPFILISLPAGVWVDRLPRRPILILGDVGRGIALASIPAAYLLGVLSIYQLYVVGFIVGVCTVFFDVAYMSYLPALVDRDRLVEGNSKLEVSRSGAQIAGPGLAGAAIGLVGAPLAIILDAISFLGSAAFVFGIRKREPAPTPTAGPAVRPSMRGEIAAGLRYVLGHRLLRSIAACTGISNFFGNVVQSILLVYIVREIGLTPAVIGLVFALGNIGFLVGAILADRISARFGVGPTIIGSALLFGPGALLVAVAPKELAVPFLVAFGLLIGFGGVVYNVTQVSLRQAITPERMQGRMNATMRFVVWGTIPIGSLLGGVVATAIGLHETIWIGAIGSLFSFLPLLFSPLRSLREVPRAGGAESEPRPGTDRDEPATADDGVVLPGHTPLPDPEER